MQLRAHAGKISNSRLSLAVAKIRSSFCFHCVCWRRRSLFDDVETVFISFLRMELAMKLALREFSVCGYVEEELQSEIKVPAVETRSFDTRNILWFCKKKVENYKRLKIFSLIISHFLLVVWK